MDSRERITTVLAGGIPDRVPYHDLFWRTTVDRWHREGLPADVSPMDYFGTEMVWLYGDYTLQLPERLVEEGENTRTYWDKEGTLKKDSQTDIGWTSQWLDYTIKTKEDWYKYRGRMAFNISRIDKPLVLEKYQRARAEGKFVCFFAHCCFQPCWEKLGMERVLMLLLDDPEWITDVFDAHTTVVLEVYEAMREMEIEFDGGFWADDLGAVAGPFLSPRIYRDLILPYHKREVDRLAQDGLKSFLHSDGNVEPLIPYFLDAGFSALHPLEAKAGLDVRKLKPKYGDRLVLMGNIDVRKLSGTKEDIEEEMASKILVAKEGGGYIYHSDHSVPHTVSFEYYCFAMKMLKRYGVYD